MRAWSGFRIADVVPLSASGPSAPLGWLTRLLLASSVLQTWASVGSCGAAGRSASLVVVPTLKAAGVVDAGGGVLAFDAAGALSPLPHAASSAVRQVMTV